MRNRIFAALFLLVGCTTMPEPDLSVPGEQGFSLPVMNGERAFVVEARIAEGPPRRFLIDTGATGSALFPLGAADLPSDYRQTKDILVRGIAFQAQRPGVVVPSVHLGPDTYADVTMALLPRSETDPDLAGIIGLDILARYAVLWQPDEGRLTFLPPVESGNLAPATWEDLPLETKVPPVVPRGLPYTWIRVGAGPVPTLIDTGSATSLINWDLAQFDAILRLEMRRQRRQWEVAGAVGRFEPLGRVVFEQLKIGNQVWYDADVIVADLPTFEDPDGEATPMIILGADFLAYRPFLLDMQALRMQLGAKTIADEAPAKPQEEAD